MSSVTPAPKRLRQEEFCEFKVSWGYMVRSYLKANIMS